MPPMLIYFRFFTPPLIRCLPRDYCRFAFHTAIFISPLMFSSRHFLRWIFIITLMLFFSLIAFLSLHVFILLLLSLLITPHFAFDADILPPALFADDIYFLFISSSSALFRRHLLSLPPLLCPPAAMPPLPPLSPRSRHATPRRRR
jgi:hypothetical protein